MVAAAQAVRGFAQQQVILTAASDDEDCVAIGLLRREDQGPEGSHPMAMMPVGSGIASYGMPE